MKRILTSTALAVLAAGVLFGFSACSSKKPTTTTAAQPTPGPAVTPSETRVPPPATAPRADVESSPISGSLAELNSKGYLKDALFEYDKADLRDDARGTLAANADWLKKYPTVQVLIEGHCDERGTAAYNLALGDRRANAARDYLASLGVDAVRMKTVSYGKERPICSDSNEGCWQREPPRRVRDHREVTCADRSALLLAALVPLAGAACVSSSDIEGLHRQMNDIEKEIQSLERKSSSKEEVAKLNESVGQQTKQLLKSNADTGVRLSELTTKMEQLEAKLEDTNRRLSQLSQQIAETQGDLARLRGSAGAAPSVSPPGTNSGTLPDATVKPPAGSGRPSPSELYDTAYGDYTKGRYALAIQGFQEYLDAYPTTTLADNAQYWIGESHYAQRKFKEAIDDFDKLLKTWPKSGKAAAALLKKGYALSEMGQKPEAVVSLQYVVNEYPASEEARLARVKLKSLGVDAR